MNPECIFLGRNILAFTYNKMSYKCPSFPPKALLFPTFHVLQQIENVRMPKKHLPDYNLSDLQVLLDSFSLPYGSFLFVFTCSAAIGCIVLSVGQGEFHGEVLHTLNYVVNQSDHVVQTLRNVTQCLSLAKNINVDQVFLPSNIKEDIDKLNVDLNTAANTMTEKTCEKSGKIRNVFSAVRSALFTMAEVAIL